MALHRLLALLATFLTASFALAGCTDSGDTDGGMTGEDDDMTADPDYGQQEVWYLHETGACDNDSEQTYFISKSDNVEDADGCGTLGVGAAGFTYTYPGRGNSTGHEQGAPFELDLFLRTDQPGPVTIQWNLRAGGATAASGTIEQDSQSAVAYTHYEAQANTVRAIDPGTQLTFEFTFTSPAGSNYHGYDGDHTSLFILG